jgi:hypothetical protein
MPPFESDNKFSSPAFFVKPFSSMLLKLGIGTLRPTIGIEVGIHGAPLEDEAAILCVVLLTDSDDSELIALKLPPPILLIITIGVVACDWLAVHRFGTEPTVVSTLSGVTDKLLEGGGLSNVGAGRVAMGAEGTEGTTGEISKLPVTEFGVGIKMAFGVMASPAVSVSASLLSTSSTTDPLSVVRLSAGLYTHNKENRCSSHKHIKNIIAQNILL